MRFTSIIPALALTLGAAADQEWHFGDVVYMGPTSGSNYIKKVTYSVTAPPVPTDFSQSDCWASIWIGISASQSDNSVPLMQPIFNWAPDNAAQGCPAANNAWCVAASTLLPDGQTDEPYVAVANNQQVDFEINTVSSGTVSQNVSIDGNVISSITNKNIGKNPTYFIAADECFTGKCGTLASYTWENVVITLATADKNFGATLSMDGASSKGFTTSDNGLTWKGAITFNKDVFA
ncbi:uncharacterized protein N0V89_006939 [Didymosphaeria variabile]|uniref:Concanavalin A-like lectin/glucanase n=1 Tax=Didymosphaeria variabile TaxID=1932322 RepID=A0A9W9CAC8_9PLEO|nr:uncharacterized protein N0V89_006939 [Didymosphaeria variabile]KAJ4351596.1 hypothetical protein N0V89_006939 [Didymosphaeria variabile]